MTLTNPHVEGETATEHLSSVDTDAGGTIDADGNGADPTVNGLRQIDSPADVTAHASGGYVANVTAVNNGNEVVVEIREGGGANTELALITGTADVTDVYIRAEGY